MTRTATLVALALVALLVPEGAALADDYAAVSLKGLTGVQVLVESFDEHDKRQGFDRRTFQTDVELKLRMAGIKVLTEEEWLAAPGNPNLYLIVHPMHKTPGEIAAYSITLQVLQDVLLERNGYEVPSAVTWEVASVGTGHIPHIRSKVKDYVDQFINAWLSVNPKK